MATVKTEKLYKVFGPNPEKVVAALEGGAGRSEVDTGGRPPRSSTRTSTSATARRSW
ncbi:hypothetical protein [Tomitella fengzijianii]|uniref:hypothetical protein n=1 Tax=Tomitella fengzijianii TaxID=2597660 RepID=UPI001F27D2A7|nr:hypothetical protein [Tomitella fengzijianii]